MDPAQRAESHVIEPITLPAGWSGAALPMMADPRVSDWGLAEGALPTATIEIVRLAREGHTDAFEVLVERYTPAMYRLAAAMAGPDDARDAVQDAFVSAWRELPKLRRPEVFEPWLRRIVVNRTRNVMRARRRRPAISLDASGEAGYDLSLRRDFRDAVDARQALDGAFNSLTADERAIVVLHYGAGYTLSDVADVTDTRLGTVKSRLHSALRRLHKVIGEDAR
jgi:RNA polymerase sigma-70 factor, ECF subfamily